MTSAEQPPTSDATAPSPATPDQPRPSSVLRVEITGQTVWQLIGAVLLTLVAVRTASAASGLLTMVALSFFFSLALEPAVRFLHQRYGWRRGAAVGVIYAAGVLFAIFMVFVLVPAIEEVASRISENGDDWIADLDEWTNDTFGVRVSDEVKKAVTGAGTETKQFANQAFGTLADIATGGVLLVFNLATVAMFTFYFTADAPKVKRAVLRLFTPKTQQRIGWTWDQAIVQTGGYFYSRLLLMAINGAGFLVTMVIVGVPLGLAVALAVFGGFVGAFIPAVGSYIGSAIPVLVTLAIRGFVPAVAVLGYALIYQQIENLFLGPRISANTMSLNGGVAFGSALAGGAIGGPIGAFVALPIAALFSATASSYARSYDLAYRSEYDDPEVLETAAPGRAATAVADPPDGPPPGDAH